MTSIRTRPAGAHAFTIVELLVVIAIIGVLVGLVVPALSGVQKRSRKSTELNNLKHLGHAWMLYANNNNDAALPGYLDAAVQMPPVPSVSRGWGVTYDYPNKSDIPIDLVQPIAGPWTWRLLSYVQFVPEFVQNSQAGTGGTSDESDDMMLNVTGNSPTGPQTLLARQMAYYPAYGYNGFYVGGYWEMLDVNGVQTPRFRYSDHRSVISPVNDTRRPVSVATTIGRISHSSDLIVFCTSTHFDTVGAQVSIANDRAGSHLVTPPWLADVHMWDQVGWNQSGSDPRRVETITTGADAPLGRHNGNAALVYADGHVDEQMPGGLLDMRKWIDNADDYHYRHAIYP